MRVLKRGDKVINLEYTSVGVEFNGTAGVSYKNLTSGGVRFDFGKIFGSVNGLNLTEVEVQEIMDYYVLIQSEIEKFLDTTIEIVSRNGSYSINGSESIKALSSRIYNDMFDRFIKANKKFFVELRKEVKNYIDGSVATDIIYGLVDEIEVDEFVAEHNGQELKQGEFAQKKCIEKNDVDFGKVGKMIDCVFVKNTIKRCS
jgi:hypothetical protein